MCLYVKKENAKLITAEKDITCYKILRKSKDRFGIVSYNTPFYGFRIELGEREVAAGYQNFHHRESAYLKRYTYVASGGFIHTFSSMQGIKSFLKNWRIDYAMYIDNIVVVKCHIPKGAQYYKGVFEGTGLASYASTELVYGKEAINPETL